jgi:hypothetical protein
MVLFYDLIYCLDNIVGLHTESLYTYSIRSEIVVISTAALVHLS